MNSLERVRRICRKIDYLADEGLGQNRNATRDRFAACQRYAGMLWNIIDHWENPEQYWDAMSQELTTFYEMKICLRGDQ